MRTNFDIDRHILILFMKLQKMSCTLLENAKTQYMLQQSTCSVINQIHNKSPSTEHFTPITSTYCTTKIVNDQEAPVLYTGQHMVVAQKRKEPPVDSLLEHHQEQAAAVKRLQTNVQLKTIGRTKQIFWNVSYLNTDTLFVLDFKANRILGFAENSKERLASKHPELIRYLPDSTDKDWMLQQKILTPVTRNCRILLLVYDEVCKIAKTDEYRSKTTVKIGDLEGFKVPEFVLHKMKVFFTELSLRSQSFLVNPATTHQVIGTTVTTTSSSISVHQPAVLAASSAIATTQTATTAAVNATIMGGTIVAADSSTQQSKPQQQKSSLSSSHATLSALLSNTVDTGQDISVDGITTFPKKENS